MVRGPERRAVEQCAVGQRAAGRRVDTGDRERLLRREARKQRSQALGQHGLARTGRPDHEEVVASRRRHLEGSATDGLAAHVGEIGLVARPGDHGRRGRVGPLRLAAQHAGQVPECRSAVDITSTHQRGFPHVTQRHHQAEGRRGVGQGDHARDVPQRSVEPELAAEGKVLRAGGVDLAGGDEQPHRDGQVQPGAALAHSRGRQVDRDAPERPGQTAGQDGGTHPVARLAHRRVGQADDGEAGKAVGHVDLDGDAAAHGSAQRGRGDGGKHAEERSRRRRFRCQPYSDRSNSLPRHSVRHSEAPAFGEQLDRRSRRIPDSLDRDVPARTPSACGR